MKRKIISLAIIGLLIGMLFNLTGCVGILTGLGLYVANEASDTVVKADAMSAAEINAFNSKFNQYEGENVSGTNVKSLLNAVLQNNKITPERTVKITGDVTEAKDVKTANTYKVQCKYDETGFINEIEIYSTTSSKTNNTTTNTTSSSKASNTAKVNEIKDEVSLLAAEAMTKYYTQTTSNYKNIGEFVAAELKNTKSLKDGYLTVNNKTVTVYSDSAKTNKVAEGTVQDTGSIQWK